MAVHSCGAATKRASSANEVGGSSPRKPTVLAGKCLARGLRTFDEHHDTCALTWRIAVAGGSTYNRAVFPPGPTPAPTPDLLEEDSMKARSLFRVLRWVGLGAAVPALWACTSRSLEAPLVKPEQTFTKTFQQTVNRNVDLLFLIDDSSSMRLSQMNLERNFPQFMTRAAHDSRRPAQRPHRRDLVRHGRRRRLDLGLLRQRQGRHLPVHGARHVHGDEPAGGRDVHLERRRRRQLHGQPGGRVHLHRGARRERVRLRAPVRGDHARARRRRRRPARGERRLSAQ